MNHVGRLDTTHDMYQPDKRAKITTRAVPPRSNGSQAEREAWMRQQQARGDARSRGKRTERVFRVICEQYGITRGQLLGRAQRHTISQARGQACRELRKLDMSYPEIARALNFRQHTSVMYHCAQPDQPPPVPRPAAIGQPSEACLNCRLTRAEAYENHMGMLCEHAEDLMHQWPEAEKE